MTIDRNSIQNQLNGDPVSPLNREQITRLIAQFDAEIAEDTKKIERLEYDLSAHKNDLDKIKKHKAVWVATLAAMKEAGVR